MTFWKDAIERAVRTAIQAGAAAILALWISAGSWDAIVWSDVLKVGAFATILSLLMALAGRQVGSSDTGSVLPPE